jgi:hypothetical protein
MNNKSRRETLYKETILFNTKKNLNSVDDLIEVPDERSQSPLKKPH